MMTDRDVKIVITGAAGFIGSNVHKALDEKGFRNIYAIVDHMNDERKKKHLENVTYKKYFDKSSFLDNLDDIKDAKIIIHLGACSDTTIQDEVYFKKNNIDYSKTLFKYCFENGIRLIYASSASTYGDGELGFDDSRRGLRPLNPYGNSKYLFDEFVLDNAEKPPQWVGLKFFNVYGPYEDHKDKMSSMIYQGFQQIRETGKMKLFKSYKPDYADGGQLRDFIYVKDVVDVIMFFIDHTEWSGVYNIGTGKARSFLDLSKAIFKTLNIELNIEYVEMPESMRDKYQYFTEANISKLRGIGYTKTFYELEEGVRDYVQKHLNTERADSATY
ncbi:MAG: ADP-glyceromanno-heptose 6-epimerase [bacterium]|nr:ADP-glyceromanno-heptose 6-epimerase [bacterium]